MKRYVNCFFLFIGMCMLCMYAAVSADQINSRRQDLDAREESLAEREKLLEEREEGLPVMSGEKIRSELRDLTEQEQKYYLVCEEGFLLVYQSENDATCLYTHIPISEFPKDEQRRIREGLSFSSMIDVMNYLESFTS